MVYGLKNAGLTDYLTIILKDLSLRGDTIAIIGTGFIAAFLSAWLAIKGLMRYISNHDFTIFAWYRIVFGLDILGTAYSGLITWSTY